MSGFNKFQSMELIDDQYITEALCAKPVKRHRARRAVLRTAAIAAAVFLAFIATINVFPATAYALSDIPVLGDIAKAVVLDPSMKECLSNDYAQYVGESQTVDGYHSEVYCMVVDPSRISVFFTSDVPEYSENANEIFFGISTSVRQVSLGINETGTEHLYEYRIDFSDGEQVPDELNFCLTYQVTDENGNTREVAYAKYTLYPDKQYSNVLKSYEINSTVEIMGQTIHVDRLDVYPTQAKLYFSTDEANTALLNDITIMLVDETGRAYPQRSDGTFGTGAANGDILSRWYESPYFSDAKTLSVQITGVSFLDKNAQLGTVDYKNKTISNMPGRVSVASMIMGHNGTLEIALKVPSDIRSQILSMEYRDMRGNTYTSDLGYMSASAYWYGDPGELICEAVDGYEYQVFSIANYKDDTYQVQWLYAPETTLSDPIIIPVF